MVTRYNVGATAQETLNFQISRCLDRPDIYDSLKFSPDGTVTLTVPAEDLINLLANAMSFE